MSFKFAHNLAVTRIPLHMRGLHAKLNPILKTASDKESSLSANLASNEQRYVTWERFSELNTRLTDRLSEMNTQFVNRFSAIEQDVSKSQSSITAIGDSLRMFETRVDKRFDELGGRMSKMEDEAKKQAEKIEQKMDKMEEEAIKQGEKMETRFTSMHGAQERTQGTMMALVQILVLPVVALIGKMGYDMYQDHKQKPE